MPKRRRGRSSASSEDQQVTVPQTLEHDEQPQSEQYLSEERVQETVRVWSKAYGRLITRDEAIEILMSVRRLAEVLLRAEDDQKQRQAQNG